ncbi:MAG TPA: biotin carboxylase N-terminal domain-containing protein [Acidimicrobiales bacterium]|nr:biotin carboxylase N-terminal domain-containing protein [Acidimicrobiales bacterium]
MFTRVAIVNRGEAAMRFIRAAREMTLSGASPVTTIALYTDEERTAMFVREADEAVAIFSGDKNAYLDYDQLERALVASRAEAVWVGWGFVSEQADFAERVEAMGLTFIGPSGAVMRSLGDKIGAKRLAERTGVPVAPWSDGAVTNLEEAAVHAAAIGYPLMVKAAAGGGGRGIRRVDEAAGLEEAFEKARREASSSFGDDTVFMERVITGGRHVEVQIIADGHGTVWAPGVRDCSIQRRNQKVIEESASTALDQASEEQAKKGAIDLARAAGYTGAGTVEFLYQPEERLLAFLEVNTRLQVEHPVTEVTTGIDLVKLQLHVARGGRLEGDAPAARGHAIEVRLNAEDPDRGFAPAPGKVERLVWAAGPGVRVETGVAQGDVIPATYDSMIAKIIGYGQDREEARARVRRALLETTVVIRGGTTNKAFLAGLLEHPDVVAGDFDTAWLDRLMGGGYRPPEQRALALVATAIDAYDAHRDVEREAFFAAATRGRPQTDMGLGHRVDARLGGDSYTITVYRTGSRRYRVLVDGHRVEASSERVGPFERRMVIGGRPARIVSILQGPEALVEVDGLPHRVSQDDGGVVRTPSPGVVVDIAVSEGDTVEAGQRLATFESMKMEVALTAPVAGRVREVLVTTSSQVNAGAPLFRLEAVTGHERAAGGDQRADFAALVADEDAGDPATRLSERLGEMRAIVLGYDHSRAEAHRVVTAYRRDRAEVEAHDAEILRGELGVLAAFADVALLSRNRRTDAQEIAEDVHNPREYFNAFLQTRDARRAALPASFEDRLCAALSNYGVQDLDPTVELDEALLWMFLAQQRAGTQVLAVLPILQYRLLHPDSVPAALDQQLLDTLDRLILATQLRHPVVGDLARRVRFLSFDEPLMQASRHEVDAQMLGHLSVLATTDDPDERARCMDLLVSCPQPLIRLMATLRDDQTAERRALIDVQTRRYYQLRNVDDIRSSEHSGHYVVTASFDAHDQRATGRALVVAADATAEGFAAPDGTLAAIAAAAGGTPVAVADVYMTWPEEAISADALSRRLASEISGAVLPEGLRRITFSVTAGGPQHDQVARYTFERDGGAAGAPFAENRVLRDLHPLIADRLHLWRLADFDLKRRPSPEDVYLFECTARDNVDDRRLIALAEVRDMTPLHDATGAVAAIPALEHVLDSCLDGIRRALAGVPQGTRPEWNRIVMYVWPPLDLRSDEWASIVRALAPRTQGLGLEQVIVQGKLAEPSGGFREVRLRMSRSTGAGVTVGMTDAPTERLQPLDAYAQKVIRSRQRGSVYPYELIPLLLGTTGHFSEYDLDGEGRLVPVERPPGLNTSAIVVVTVVTATDRYPDGMTRVAVLGDPTMSLGSVSEPECRRIIAAIDLADSLGAPLEWFAVCSGAKIAMDSGTENLDWVARVLRRLVEFTQAGGEVNVVVAGINVGAQPYWNAEATMLMHTKGILVMTPESAMVLTGKRSLEYSGGVAAEDNFGIGGYDRIMGPNGQAQYWAPDLAGACQVLLTHYEFAYVAPGERFPRRADTADPVGRDISAFPHHGEGTDIVSVGGIFSDHDNPERKKAFDMRTLMRAVADQDRQPLERWAETRDAETAIVFDAFLGGYAATVIGIESRTVPRVGLVPADGPASWSGGTLFPLSSRKVARAVNAASANRPVVVLANLSGFDGSPESLRNLQLEYGAEIGRAIVNFDGPIVFCVVSRYHGGAFVVFSAVLNDNMEVAAVEGSYASVLGGGPAAAVVFVGQVDRRTDADPRLVALAERIEHSTEAEGARLRAEADTLRIAVRAEKQAEIAAEFDRIHSVARAKEVGSVHTIIPAPELRPYLVDAVERGMGRTAGEATT